VDLRGVVNFRGYLAFAEKADQGLALLEELLGCLHGG